MSKIEIINRALLKLGEPPVSSLNDAAFGRSYDIIYNDVKSLLLSTYPWRFAVKVEHLTKIYEPDAHKNVPFKYPLPTDCLLVTKVFGTKKAVCTDVRFKAMTSYEIADNCIVTAIAKGIAVEYVRVIDDDAVFPPLFREAVAAKMAAELAMRLKHSLQLKQAFENEFLTLIRQAELNNEIVKDTEEMPDNSWVLVRSSCW